MRIHLVVNVSWIVWYKEQVERQKIEEVKPVEIEGVEEWEVKKILNKRKVRVVVRITEVGLSFILFFFSFWFFFWFSFFWT